MPVVDSLKYGRGIKELAANNSPPRIVWVPAQDQYAIPDVSDMNARSLMIRWAGVDAHVWGKDEEACEELFHQLASALRQTYTSSQALQMVGGRWITQEMTDAGYLKQGEVYVLSFALGIPVTREPFNLAAVTDIAHEPGVAGDGVLTCDEP